MNLSIWLKVSVWVGCVASPATVLASDNPYNMASVIDDNGLEDIAQVKDTPFYDMAKSVARVETFGRDGFCTGIRLSETLFMTNFHCWQSGGCRVRFRLGYERHKPNGEQAVYECTEVLAKAADLDFAVYRVRPLHADQMAYPSAILSKKPLAVGEPLIAPGHPVLKPKQIDVSPACKVTRAVPYIYEGVTSMQHQCDTEGGSSGSPLIDRLTGHVVALHWGSAGITGANHGVPMTLILDRIESSDPGLYAELTVVDD